MAKLSASELLNALANLGKLLDSIVILYIVVGSPADYPPGISTIVLDDSSTLVGKENFEDPNIVSQHRQGIDMLESSRWREKKYN